MGSTRTLVFNDCSSEMDGNVAMIALQKRANAASAIAARAKGGCVRILPIRTRRSERQVYGYGGSSENFTVTAIWHTNVAYFTRLKGDGRL